MKQTKFSKIGESPFFKVPDDLCQEQIILYCELWHPFLKSIPLGIAGFIGRISNEIRTEEFKKNPNTKRIDLFTNLIKSLLPIVSDEFGVGRDPGLMLHQVFDEQVKLMSSNEEVLVCKKKNTFPVASSELFDVIMQKSLAPGGVSAFGLTAVIIFEAMAPNLFAVHERIFSHVGITHNLLQTSRFHPLIENDHAARAIEMEQWGIQLFGEKKMLQAIELLTSRWSNYLDYVAKQVYEPVAVF